MMNCKTITFSGHALQKLFARNIAEEMIAEVIAKGEIVKEYADDKPFPSYLLLGFVNQIALHVVLAKDEKEERCIIVTAYFPDIQIWNSDFKTKK